MSLTEAAHLPREAVDKLDAVGLGGLNIGADWLGAAWSCGVTGCSTLAADNSSDPDRT